MAELLAVEGLTAGYGDSIVLEDVALAIDVGPWPTWIVKTSDDSDK